MGVWAYLPVSRPNLCCFLGGYTAALKETYWSIISFLKLEWSSCPQNFWLCISADILLGRRAEGTTTSELPDPLSIFPCILWPFSPYFCCLSVVETKLCWKSLSSVVLKIHPGIVSAGHATMKKTQGCPKLLYLPMLLSSFGINLRTLESFAQQQYLFLVVCPPPGDLANPGIEPRSPSLQADSLPSQPPGKPLSIPALLKLGSSCKHCTVLSTTLPLVYVPLLYSLISKP